MASDDPDFECKAADIIGLYLDHAASMPLYSAWTRRPRSKRSTDWIPCWGCHLAASRPHGFEYYRHGTLSLYAALDVRTGKVQGKTAARHTSDEFVSFLDQVVCSCKPKQEIHVILDNLSAHKTSLVRRFWSGTPASDCISRPPILQWLNQGEISGSGRLSARSSLAESSLPFATWRASSGATSAPIPNSRPFNWKYSDVLVACPMLTISLRQATSGLSLRNN